MKDETVFIPDIYILTEEEQQACIKRKMQDEQSRIIDEKEEI